MSLILQPVRTRQPNQSVSVSRGNPLHRGLKALWSAHSPTYVAGIGTRSTYNAALSSGTDGRNIAMTSTATTGANLGPNDNLFPATECTIAISLRWTDTTARSVQTFGCNDAGNNRVLMEIAGSNLVFDYGNPSNGSGRLSATYAKDTTPERLVLTAGATVGRQAWRRGVLIASNASATANKPSIAQDLAIGYSTGLSNNSDAVEIYQFAVIWRVWSPAEIRSWCANPWQLFAPDPRLLSAH